MVTHDMEVIIHVALYLYHSQGSLAPKYNGPFKVLARSDKYFAILRYGHHDKISVDRLKPFHKPSYQTTRPAQTLFQTPTGTAFLPKRISKPPDRLGYSRP